MSLTPGIRNEKIFRTSRKHSASFLGSGDVEVLSTPSMITFMEETCRTLVENKLSKELTTVGTLVNIRHLKAAPIGAEVKVICTLTRVEGRRLLFDVKAFWKNVKIGEGVHERYIVVKEKFLRKLKELVKESS